MNRKNFKRTLEHIEAHPELWDQTEYDCGSSHCFIGWAAVLSEDDSQRAPWRKAIDWLEISDAEEGWIAAEDRTRAELQAFYERGGIPS